MWTWINRAMHPRTETSSHVSHPTGIVVTARRSGAKICVNILASYMIVTSLLGIYSVSQLEPKITENEDFSEVINFYIVVLTLTVIRLNLGVLLVVGNMKGITWILHTLLGMIAFELALILVVITISQSEGLQRSFLWQMSLVIWLAYAIRILYQRSIEVKVERRIKAYMTRAIHELLRNKHNDDEPPRYETVVEADTQNLLGQQ